MMAIINSIKDPNDPVEMANVFELCKKFNSDWKGEEEVKIEEMKKELKKMKEEMKDEKQKFSDEFKMNNLKINDLNKNIVKEEWKIIDQCSKYKISNYGRLQLVRGAISKKKPETDGYIRVGLARDDNTIYNESIHKLVALHFIRNDDPINKTQVDHINRIRDENYVWNLRWVTPGENNKNRNISKEKKYKRVAEYDLNNNFVRNWNSMKEISNTLGISEAAICNNCIGVYKICDRTRIFKYVEEIFDGEIWKISPDHPYIKVSNYGRIDIKRTGKTYGCLNDRGYYVCGSKYKSFLVHRLVCKAFNPVPNCDNLVVDHIDGNPKNNHSDNLEFVTSGENSQRAHDNGAYKNTYSIKITQYTLDMKFVKNFNTISELLEELHIDKKIVHEVCRGERKSHRGFIFEYTKK